MAVKAGDGSVNEATMTQMQELSSAWVFKRAIQNNPNWGKWEDIRNDHDTFSEIKRIWQHVGKVNWVDDVDNQWIENFYEQQKELISKIQRPEFTEFVRSEDYQLPKTAGPNAIRPTGQTFMEWVTTYIKQEFEIGNKDNWNPADIWLIKNEERHKNYFKEHTAVGPYKGDGMIIAQLKQFNEIFRQMYISKEIMGISLKKVGKGAATYKEINVTQEYFKNIEATSMKLTGVKCYLGTKRINIKVDTNKKSPTYQQEIVDEVAEARAIRKGLGTTGYPTIETQDSWLFIKDEDNSVEYKVQIKNTGTSGFDNLKFEPTQVGKGSARMGKATREFVFDIMEAYGILSKFPKTHQQHPKTKATFQQTQKNQLGQKIKDITAKCKRLGMTLITTNDTGKADNKTSLDWGSIDVPSVKGPINIAETLGKKNEAWTANSKLQQISFLNAVLSLPLEGEKSINHFCTDLIYLAAKQGRRGGYYNTGYGPFGKIY